MAEPEILCTSLPPQGVDLRRVPQTAPAAPALSCSRIRRGRRSSGPTNRCCRCRAPVASTSSIRRRRHRNRRRRARRTTDAHARAHDGGDGDGDDAAPAARALQRAETTVRAALKTPASRTRPLRWQRLPMPFWSTLLPTPSFRAHMTAPTLPLPCLALHERGKRSNSGP